MNKIVPFSYEGRTISFEFEDGVKMINTTEMACRFDGKFVADILQQVIKE